MAWARRTSWLLHVMKPLSIPPGLSAQRGLWEQVDAEQGELDWELHPALGFWPDAHQHPKCSYSSQSEGLAALGRAPGSCFGCFPFYPSDVLHIPPCPELPRHLHLQLLHGKASGMLRSHPHHELVPGDGTGSRCVTPAAPIPIPEQRPRGGDPGAPPSQGRGTSTL